jgi:class 3 adenylate cyclase
VATAFVLLAEAVLTIIVARSWHATWWEWHVLMGVAFLVILLTARAEYARQGSITGAFGGLYMERTLERLDQRQADSLTAMVEAIRAEEPLAPLMARLQTGGTSAEEVASLERSARELVRVDTLFRQYAGPRLADRLQKEPAFAELGGKEIDVTVLFADLADFTTFSEGRTASEVIEMLNGYWEGTVPVVVDREGGLIERFAGDAIMAVFNALDDQPDHALHAARAALAMQEQTQRTAAEHPEWPRFRIGLNSGSAVIGNVGATGQRSFAAIGDTTNVAARVQAVAKPGQVLLAATTYELMRGRARVEPLGATSFKGRAEAIDVYELHDVTL